MTEEPTSPPRWWLLRYSPGPAWQATLPADEQLSGHREGIFGLFEQGKLIAAGPTPRVNDTALSLVRDLSEQDVADFVAHDPAVKDGRLVVTVEPWDVLLTHARD